MSHQIQRVAVLGAGVMGAGIAAHLANAGVPSYLFDLNADMANGGLKNAIKAKPAAFYKKGNAALVTPCTYDDDAAKLAECDWIIEVVVERLDIKKKVFGWIADNRREGSIVTSNTSGIKLSDMAADMPEEMRSNFFITHFFNPPRYMKLLEFVTSDDTSADAIATLADFGANVLGKGIVYGKDTPNFVANRIGTFDMAAVVRHMGNAGLTIEEVDAIFSTSFARSKSAVFKTGDIVGIDTMKLVFGNVYHNAPDDEERDVFVVPAFIDKMIEAGATGRKAGAGFYKKVGRNILVLDTETGEYRGKQKVRYDSIGKAKKAETPQDKVRAMISGDDKASVAAWTVLADTLIYAANRIPEIADDHVQIDNAMKWGFGWELGPFEMWDAVGVQEGITRMEADGRTVPAWVKDMVAGGRTSFYARVDDTNTYWQRDGGSAVIPGNPNHLFLSELKHHNRELERNSSASIWDLGDGVLGFELHSKMNSLDPDITKLYNVALDKLEGSDDWQALVVGNQDPRAFGAGANIFLVMMAAMQKQFDQIDAMLVDLQTTMQRARYSSKPVVTAPFGMALGGGLELAMQGNASVAFGELYAGQVEVGVGLIPGAGGCKELLRRYLGDIPPGVDYDPNPFVQAVFKLVALATTSTSAEEARDYGFLRPTDRVVLDQDSLLAEAKKTALGMASTFEAPKQRTFKLPGTSGHAAIELFLYSMKEGGYASEHDLLIGHKLAHVLTGGDVPSGTVVTEQHILDLEREVFLSLVGTEKTLARIQHMLQTNKPLRN